MDNIAPMLRHLGYDPFANPPDYGDADLKVKENTNDIQVDFILIYIYIYICSAQISYRLKLAIVTKLCIKN